MLLILTLVLKTLLSLMLTNKTYINLLIKLHNIASIIKIEQYQSNYGDLASKEYNMTVTKLI